MELRPAFRDERQLLRHDVRAVDAGRDQPGLRQTHGATPAATGATSTAAPIIGDADPVYDDCCRGHDQRDHDRHERRRPAQHRRSHLGLVPGRLQAHGRTATPSAARAHLNIGGASVATTSPTTSRSSTTRRRPTRRICRRLACRRSARRDQANHQYDLSDFDAALAAGNLPRSSFLKAPAYRGRPRRLLRPARRAAVLVNTVNAIQQRRTGTHRDRHHLRRLRRLVRPRHDAPIVNPSTCRGSRAQRPGHCGNRWPPPLAASATAAATARGCRSSSSRRPRSRTTSTTRILDQTSIIRFIEDNWG